MQSILICSCNSTEHQMVIYKTTDKLYGPEAYVHVHLVKRSFWYRLKYGIKYIFGYTSKYGAWDEFILNAGHVNQLQHVINHLNETVQTTTNS
jgi:hypothetical protein